MSPCCSTHSAWGCSCFPPGKDVHPDPNRGFQSPTHSSIRRRIVWVTGHLGGPALGVSCTRESVTAAAVRDPLSCRQTDMYPNYRTGHGSVPGAVRETLRMGKLLLAGVSWASFLAGGAFELGLEGKVEF